MTRAQPPSISIHALERTVITAASGDPNAWSQLMAQLEPLVRWLAARCAGSKLSEPGHNDLFVRVVDRLRTNDRRGLVQYLHTRSQYPDLDFVTYLGAVVAGAMADYVRRRPKTERPCHDAARELESTVADPTACIRQDIDSFRDAGFSRSERRALLLWLHGNDTTEIAAEIGLSSGTEARQLLESARSRLRLPVTDSP